MVLGWREGVDETERDEGRGLQSTGISAECCRSRARNEISKGVLVRASGRGRFKHCLAGQRNLLNCENRSTEADDNRKRDGGKVHELKRTERVLLIEKQLVLPPAQRLPCSIADSLSPALPSNVWIYI